MLLFIYWWRLWSSSPRGNWKFETKQCKSNDVLFVLFDNFSIISTGISWSDNSGICIFSDSLLWFKLRPLGIFLTLYAMHYLFFFILSLSTFLSNNTFDWQWQSAAHPSTICWWHSHLLWSWRQICEGCKNHISQFSSYHRAVC